MQAESRFSMSLAVNQTEYTGWPQKRLEGALASGLVFSAPWGCHWPCSLLGCSPTNTTIAQVKPSSPNRSFGKMLQQQHVHPKPVFTKRGWYMLFFLTKNKNKKPKSKEKDKKADFLPKIEWRSPPPAAMKILKCKKSWPH